MKSRKEDEPLVPGQVQGQHSGAQVEVSLSGREPAIALYEKVRLRIMNINLWEEYGGAASFKLVNHEGQEVMRLPREGDYIRINLPGPGPRSGSGYDWVRIEKMEDRVDESEDESAFVLQVRPAPDPTANSSEEAHFFTDAATSSFVVQRKGSTVKAQEQGRNEVSNTEVERTSDKVRNALYATAASHGMAHLQWRSMLEGMLTKE